MNNCTAFWARVILKDEELMSSEPANTKSDSALGLCANCLHARVIASAKGSQFLLCQLSQSDSRFPKYPRLPVLQCPGHTPEAPTA